MQAFADHVAALRPMLVRFARRKLDNDAWADDAVSETLLAALARPASFGGRAQLATWLVGILKHKIADQIQRHVRERPFVAAGDDEADDDVEALSDAATRHADSPYADWDDPLDGYGRRQFMADLRRCLQALPARQVRAFLLRNWHEAATEEICGELGITANHLGVLLHRTRQRLRDALPHWQPA